MKTRGFTLLELLISTAIVAVLILTLYSAFQTGILSYNKMDSASNIYQTARILFYRMTRDIANSFSYAEKDSRFIGNKQTLEFFSVADTFEKGEAVPSVCRIKYSSADFALKRGYLSNLAAITVKEIPQDSQEELTSDAKELTFEYACASDNSDAPYNWQDSWPVQNNQEQLQSRPLAVKVKLVLVERDKKKKEIGTVEFNKVIPLYGK